jgi:hypothetical protein
MQERSARATYTDYLLVGGLALLCLVLVITVMHRNQDSIPPAPPPATATLQPQTAAATQAIPGATSASQPQAAPAAPGQPPVTEGIGAAQPTPSAPTPEGTVSGATHQPTFPSYRQGQNM